MKTTTAYKLIDWKTNELVNISLSFEGLSGMYLGSKHPDLHIIKAYPGYDEVSLGELKERVDGSGGFIDFTYEPRGGGNGLMSMFGFKEEPIHYAICKIDILV